MEWVSVGLGGVALVVAIVAAVQVRSLEKRLASTSQDWSNQLTRNSGSLQRSDDQLEERVEVLERALTGR